MSWYTQWLCRVEAEKADGTQDAAIIEVETDEGITGIGEADSSPAVVDAVVNAPVSHDKSSGLETVVLGRDPFDVEVLWNEMFDRSYFYGRKGAAITAISGIDMALWDIIGKATGKPVHKLIGGAHREEVRAYASTLFPEDPANTEAIRDRAQDAFEEDFTAVKFGWGGFGESYETDRSLLGAARDVLGDEFDLMVDAGMVWGRDVKRAIKDGNRLDEDSISTGSRSPSMPTTSRDTRGSPRTVALVSSVARRSTLPADSGTSFAEATSTVSSPTSPAQVASRI